MNYHEQLIELLLQQPTYISDKVGMSNFKLKRGPSLGSFGDIDLIGEGSLGQVIVEVKSHSGLISHYLRIQLPKYIEQYPKATQEIIS